MTDTPEKALYRKATPAENLVALKARLFEHLSPAEKDELDEVIASLASPGQPAAPTQEAARVKYERMPEYDKRISKGDDYAGDAYMRWVAVGHHPNESAAPVPSAQGEMVLVPREPTQEMHNAAHQSEPKAGRKCRANIWRSMVAAALRRASNQKT